MRKRRKRLVRSTRRPRRVTTFENQTACWILRTLARVAKCGGSVRRTPYDYELLASLGVQAPAPAPDKVPDRAAVHRAIVEQIDKLDAEAAEPSLASENAGLIGKMLGLSETEIEILALTIALEAEDSLGSSFGALRARNLSQIAIHVAAVLGLRQRDVEQALRRDGKLRDLTLLQLTPADLADSGPLRLGVPVSLVLMRPLQNEDDLLSHFLDAMPPSTLSLDDYPHLAKDLDLLQHLLRATLDERESGINVLLHGPPGTGKTELARALAQSIDARLDSVKLVDVDDDVRDGSARLESYALCQRILSGRKGTVLLFDEAEDAFPSSSWLTQLKSGRNKAWTNRLLESNPVPTIWISNAIEQIDRAFIRRFDLVLEVGAPPRSVRRSALEKHLSGFSVPSTALDQLADRDELSPGHVQRAGRVLRLLHTTGDRNAEADVTRVLDRNLRAYAGPAKRRRKQAELRYDFSLLQTDTDARALVNGLARSRAGTVCFHGPPGTGKTALAHEIARELDLPLHDYRASDLMSKWVGDTERAMARMFERAADENAVLLLDEADSFLAERSCAKNSWEVTQVNEMLTQMEHFEGVFICSTNLVEHLDRAALRRFAVKVRFEYLRGDQVELLFRQVLGESSDASVDATAMASVQDVRRLRNLTPGDFAAVVRRMRVLGVPAVADALLRALREEVALKRDRGGKAVGFAG